MDEQSTPAVMQTLAAAYQVPVGAFQQTLATAVRASVSGVTVSDSAEEYQKNLDFVDSGDPFQASGGDSAAG